MNKMTYKEKSKILSEHFNLLDEIIEIPGSEIEIRNIKFSSDSWKLLPGANEYYCEKHNLKFTESNNFRDEITFQQYPEFLKHDDINIQENNEFVYTIFRKVNDKKADSVIFLFHGLNEKHWNKYLLWAEKLVEETGKTVILFPIAYHMNRSPQEWSNSRLMNNVKNLRRQHSPSITNSTFANAAISARIQMIPQRFFWSGLQTFYDVVKLVQQIRANENYLVEANASIDFFSYSIGSFLGEILMMTNPKDLFKDSRLFMFCGGPTLDRMSPNSKFILDSDATIAIYSFYTERLESELKMDKRIAHYFNGDHKSGSYFRSMLSYKKLKELREKRFNELSDRIYAVALKNDEVIPSNEVVNTLKGDYRDIPVQVDILDFPYDYSHINLFPDDQDAVLVDKAFNKVFGTATEFLK